MSRIRDIESLEVEDKLVFVRLDLNVPLDGTTITSDARLRAALPAIQALREKGARVGLASHLGRPNGQRQMAYSLEPVGARLSELLDTEVFFAEDCIGDSVRAVIRELRAGGVMLLENLRFHRGEKDNDPEFARTLAAPFSHYVNDAFGSCHRAHASIVGVVPHLADPAAGPLLAKEVAALSKLLEPERPFVAIVGGAKVADKIGVLGTLLKHAQTICIGGAMAYTFLKARGEEVGNSKWEGHKLQDAVDFMKKARDRNVSILLPTDHVIADAFDAHAQMKMVGADDIPEGWLGLDIGPDTRQRFSDAVKGAKTVVWNGPMGVFEWDKFAQGTLSVAKAVAACPGYTVVGGGDSVSAVEKADVVSEIDHVSTGGGASLEFIEHASLPGIEALAGRYRGED